MPWRSMTQCSLFRYAVALHDSVLLYAHAATAVLAAGAQTDVSGHANDERRGAGGCTRGPIYLWPRGREMNPRAYIVMAEGLEDVPEGLDSYGRGAGSCM